jgi:hypothetical protein
MVVAYLLLLQTPEPGTRDEPCNGKSPFLTPGLSYIFRNRCNDICFFVDHRPKVYTFRSAK